MSCNRFENKTVLVVGAGAGMGEATALQFAGEGAKVIALDIYQDRLDRLMGKAAGLPGSIETYPGDICNVETVNGVVELIKNKYGTLDTIAYVAGVMDFMCPPEEVDDELWDRVMDVNVKSVWRTVKTAIPLMKGHKGDSANITIVSSLGGYVGSSSGTVYITSKHAVEGLMKNLAFTYKDENVRVNCVAPGAFATEINDTTMRMFPDRDFTNYKYGQCPEGVATYLSKGIGILNPQTNIGKPQYIADAICFLSSNEAKFVNGASLIVDGGWYSA